ncbi:MAG: HDIG domain-containing metalloprotein [Chloroflexota bacterium]
MDSPDSPSLKRRFARIWGATRLWLILALGVVGTLLGISAGALQDGSALILSAGDVATQDILAPYALPYESEVLTEQSRVAAEEAVAEIYDPPENSIAREQLGLLEAALDYIGAVRADAYATEQQRLQDLLSLELPKLSPGSARAILAMPPARWEAVRLEAFSVLEQVMRGEIREGRLEDARRGLPTLVSISMAEDQADLVVELVSALITPNARYNASETELSRQQARAAVAHVSRTFAPGETIITRGQVVGELEIEALERFGLLEPPDRLRELAFRALIVTVLAGAFTLFAYRVYPEFVGSMRLVGLTAVLFVVTSLGMGFAIPERTILPYLFPAAMLPMLMAILVGPGMGVMSALVLGALAGLVAQRGLELGLYYMLSGVLGALVIGRAERLSIFVWAGLAADLAAVAVVVAFRFPDPTTDVLGKASLLGAAIVTGLVSASLVFGLLVLIGNLLGITTNLQLIELSRPDHPLLQLLLRSAPGTYQHSLQVANLAEQAARAIGANALLIRVGALYHDVGKSVRPQFFIENQLSGQNIHEQLDPATSASMILAHVADGLELARKYRIPKVVADFIPEHHGRMRTSYQFHVAREAAGKDADTVDPRNFTYPGPRPRSKETAILMLADGVEAKIRADMPEDEAALDKAVAWVIEDRLSTGQLSRTDLTLKDLDTIQRSFVTTLRSIYHPRIRYPSSEGEREEELTGLDAISAADESDGRPAPLDESQALSPVTQRQEP